MTKRRWVRRMTMASLALLVVGLALMIVGSIIAGARPASPMGGIGVGLVGVFLLAAGGLFGKFAVAGPYPDNLEAES